MNIESSNFYNDKKIKSPILAVVIPCYNECEIINLTHAKMCEKLHKLIMESKIDSKSFICYIDDGSKDNTWEMLEKFALDSKNANNIDSKVTDSKVTESNSQNHSILDSKVTDSIITDSKDSNNTESNPHKIKTIALKLSRNVGHQNALLAGLCFVKERSDCAISIDADLQDDISTFDEFIAQYKSGCDIVYGVRDNRESDSIFKRKSALFFYDLMKFLGVNIVHNHADFRLLSSRAIESLLQFKEANLFLRGIIPLLGYKSAQVRYTRLAREAGISKYPLRKMLSFAWGGVTSFSIAPLRFVSGLGFIFFILSIILGAYVLYVRFFTHSYEIGWASMLIPLSFFSGLQLLSLGIIGEYIGKIYAESKHRPRYFIEQIV